MTSLEMMLRKGNHPIWSLMSGWLVTSYLEMQFVNVCHQFRPCTAQAIFKQMVEVGGSQLLCGLVMETPKAAS